MVSLSYHDAGRWLDAQETVEQVPAPPHVVEWLRAFAQEHYVVEPKKRQRPESFRPLQDRFGNPASVSTEKKFGGGGMSDGFLGRWSRRKLDAKDGKPLDGRAAARGAGGSGSHAWVRRLRRRSGSTAGDAERPQAPDEIAAEVPPPTLEDVKALTAESDFSRFVARGVTPDVKNAAMKKLFADPRYNVMDGLDVYIDDYSQPKPIAPSRVAPTRQRQVPGPVRPGGARGSKRLRLGPGMLRITAPANPWHSPIPSPQAVPEPTDHADPDLRLQQDDAAAGDDPGRGAG